MSAIKNELNASPCFITFLSQSASVINVLGNFNSRKVLLLLQWLKSVSPEICDSLWACFVCSRSKLIQTKKVGSQQRNNGKSFLRTSGAPENDINRKQSQVSKLLRGHGLWVSDSNAVSSMASSKSCTRKIAQDVPRRCCVVTGPRRSGRQVWRSGILLETCLRGTSHYCRDRTEYNLLLVSVVVLFGHFQRPSVAISDIPVT